MDSKSQHALHKIETEIEYLSASQYPGGVLVLYKNIFGKQLTFYKNGLEMRKIVQTGGREFSHCDDLQRSKEAYATLGPKLRKELPAEWLAHLGNYLTAEKFEEDLASKSLVPARLNPVISDLTSMFFSKNVADIKAEHQIDWTKEV
jgi:hypothetical protein